MAAAVVVAAVVVAAVAVAVVAQLEQVAVEVEQRSLHTLWFFSPLPFLQVWFE